MPSQRWGILHSFLALSPLLIGTPFLAYKKHSTLPTPITTLTDPITNLPHVSESRILEYAKYLSEDIGYRTVGTREHALADTWMYEQALSFKEDCERILRQSGSSRKLECEVWRQQGNGSHRFDMMGKRLYKTYVDLTNIIVRVSDGTPTGKEHAVLVNAHLDSTLPSPGAADDALSVGIMLECMRVLIQTPNWEPGHAIIFLFNHAEESLQDGSHLFSTQHPIASTVRAMINLEAAGSTGRELLFQATSEDMIQAYASVPRPYGSVFANDIFSSGVIMSDTDFRQFEEYLNVTGLDMAIVGNSYLYHMRKDLVENIEPGVAQHMAENTLSLLRHLSALSTSSLPVLAEQGYTRPTTVFFNHLDFFIIYSFTTAKVIYLTLWAAAVILAFFSLRRAALSPIAKKGKNIAKPESTARLNVSRELQKGILTSSAGFIGTVALPNTAALVMDKVLGRGMSWFSHEYLPIVLYGPPALFGVLFAQALLPAHALPSPAIREHALFVSLLLMNASAAVAVQFIGVGSAAAFFLGGAPLFVGMLSDFVVSSFSKNKSQDGLPRRVSLWAYALAIPTPLMMGSQLMLSVCDVFVPLTGRMGNVPADNIVATIVSIVSTLGLPLAIPFAHRFGRRALIRSIVILGAISAVNMAVFYVKEPFDGMHQKRMFVLHLENVTSQERHLHVASADGAPGFDNLVQDMVHVFAESGNAPEKVVMNDHNSDWDPLYPFSAFLSPYKVKLPTDANYVSPWTSSGTTPFSVIALKDERDPVAGTRSLLLQINHPGLIWTVIAFDAHVLRWSLDDNPPDEYVRHHIKEASFYNVNAWTVELVIKLPSSDPQGGLKINHIGLQESGMWPGKKAEKLNGGKAMEMFEQLDLWLQEKTSGTVDPTLMGCVAGVTTV